MNPTADHRVMLEDICAIAARVCQAPEVAEQPDRNLYEDQLMDSLAFLQLLYTLEDRYSVEIYPTRLCREDLASPRHIAALVERLRCQG